LAPSNCQKLLAKNALFKSIVTDTSRLRKQKQTTETTRRGARERERAMKESNKALLGIFERQKLSLQTKQETMPRKNGDKTHEM
jgi:nanoRNase/pAp phosphatase (c-di-AMP/oligoRNAs hydrolase)